MHRSLTVKEVLIYQANLRLPSSVSNDEKKRRINEVKYKVFAINLDVNTFSLQNCEVPRWCQIFRSDQNKTGLSI